MITYLPAVLGILALLAVIGLAVGLASPLRQRARLYPRGLIALIAAPLTPLLALALTPSVIWLLARNGPMREWLGAQSKAIETWQTFWLGVLVITVVESLLRQFWALRRRSFPIPDLIADIMRGIAMILVGFFVLKVELGWDITPLLASTALVTAVIGFALQGVLGNLLAGMSLHLTRTVHEGDWINLGEIEGRVSRTNWRETRMQSIHGEEYIIPNARLADTMLHNLSRPEPMRRHRINVGASYSDAPDEVIAALIAAAREVPEVLAEPAPDAMVTAFLDFGINYRLRFWSRQYHQRGYIDGQVCRHIWYKFKRSGIEIPFPMSDKLLNDVVTVMDHQRRLEPPAEDVEATVRDLLASDLRAKLVVDVDGRPLLTREDLARVAPRVERQLWTRGEVVMRQGEPGETFYVIARGKLAGAVTYDREEPTTNFTVGAGAVVGEMSLLAGAPRGATLTVDESCELLAFGHEAFVALLGLRPEVPERLAALAASRRAANVAAAEVARREHDAADEDDGGKEGILRRLLSFLGG